MIIDMYKKHSFFGLSPNTNIITLLGCVCVCKGVGVCIWNSFSDLLFWVIKLSFKHFCNYAFYENKTYFLIYIVESRH